MSDPHLFAAFMLANYEAPMPRGMMRRHPKHQRQYPNGPCKVCGQPNVRRGRETGVYLCEQHYHESEAE